MSTSRPIVTLDLDGVICGPLLGLNLGISRAFLDPEAAPGAARVPPHWLTAILDPLRFDSRRPLPGVREALRALREVRTVFLLTGRRSDPARWLRRHGLDGCFDGVTFNAGPLRSPHFKLDAVTRLGAAEHVDDDGRTAQLLAQRSSARVYLCDWPRNRETSDVHYAAGVTRVDGLPGFVRLVRLGRLGRGEG